MDINNNTIKISSSEFIAKFNEPASYSHYYELHREDDKLILTEYGAKGNSSMITKLNQYVTPVKELPDYVVNGKPSKRPVKVILPNPYSKKK